MSAPVRLGQASLGKAFFAENLNRLPEDRSERTWEYGSTFRWLALARACSFQDSAIFGFILLCRGPADGFVTTGPGVGHHPLGPKRWQLGSVRRARSQPGLSASGQALGPVDREVEGEPAAFGRRRPFPPLDDRDHHPRGVTADGTLLKQVRVVQSSAVPTASTKYVLQPGIGPSPNITNCYATAPIVRPLRSRLETLHKPNIGGHASRSPGTVGRNPTTTPSGTVGRPGN